MTVAKASARRGKTRATQELAVLADGPRSHRWYWRDDLAAMQQASRNVGYDDWHPASVMRHYEPTEDFEMHPGGLGAGRVWRYRMPERAS
jgi:hypothetical protein